MPSSRPPQSFSTDLFRPEALAIIAQGKLASEKPHYRNLNSLPVGGFFVVIPRWLYLSRCTGTVALGFSPGMIRSSNCPMSPSASTWSSCLCSRLNLGRLAQRLAQHVLHSPRA